MKHFSKVNRLVNCIRFPFSWCTLKDFSLQLHRVLILWICSTIFKGPNRSTPLPNPSLPTLSNQPVAPYFLFGKLHLRRRLQPKRMQPERSRFPHQNKDSAPYIQAFQPQRVHTLKSVHASGVCHCAFLIPIHLYSHSDTCGHGHTCIQMSRHT